MKKMKITFPCKITYSDEDKCWYVESPGFYDGVLTYGDTLEDAKVMAAEAVSGLIESHLKYGDTFYMPIPSLHADGWYNIPLNLDDAAKNIFAAMPGLAGTDSPVAV